MKKYILTLLMLLSVRSYAQMEPSEIDFNPQNAQLNAAEIIAAAQENYGAREDEVREAEVRELSDGKIEVKARNQTYVFPSLEEWKSEVKNLNDLNPEEFHLTMKKRAAFLKAAATALHYTKFVYGVTGIAFDPIKAGFSYGMEKLGTGFGKVKQIYSRLRGNPIRDLAERSLEPKERTEKNIAKRSQQIVDRWLKGIDRSYVESAYISRRNNEIGVMINADVGFLAGVAKSFIGNVPGLQIMIGYNSELKTIMLQASVYSQVGIETSMPFGQVSANARVGFYRAVTEKGKIIQSSTVLNLPSPPIISVAIETATEFQAVVFGGGMAIGTGDAAIITNNKILKIFLRTNVGTFVGLKRYFYSDGKATLVFAKNSVVDIFESIALLVPQYRLIACKRLFAF